MSEANETPVPVEKEPGAVKRVAERIGKFLSETYTIKGAKAKEMRKYEKLYDQFTPSQRAEMMEFYDQKITKGATWKVIRNWVATGAGVALGWSVAHFGLPAVWQFVTQTAPAAIAGGTESIRNWLFEPHQLRVNLPDKLRTGPKIPFPTELKFNWVKP